MDKITFDNLRAGNILVVKFNKPVDGVVVHYFGSVAAIFEALPEEVIGMRKYRLYREFGKASRVLTGKCIIYRASLWRIKNKNKRNGNND